MSTISNAVLLIVNTNSYGLPFRPVGVYITTLEPNLAYFSANVKVISGSTTFSANNRPNASPVRYILANTNTFKFVTRETTLVPNLAYFSANVKVISVTTTPAYAGPNPAINYAEDQVAYPYVRYPAFLYNIKATEQTLNNATMNLRTIYTTTTPASAGPRPNINYSQTQTKYPYITYPAYLYNIKGSTFEPNLAYYSANVKAISVTTTFSVNNVPNAAPVRYSLANDSILRFVTRITTLTPNLAFFSANMKAISTTTTFSPNNVPNAVPVRYSLANDSILRFISRGATLEPNLAYYSANVKVFSVLTLYNSSNPVNLKYIGNVVYTANTILYSTRGPASTLWYQTSSIKQFWT